MHWRKMDDAERRYMHKCASHECEKPPAWVGSAGYGEDEVSSCWCDDCKRKIEAFRNRGRLGAAQSN